MNIEEKAKAYDESLEKARECLKDGTITNTAIAYIETIFPELKKSEDEKIRKEILDYIDKSTGCKRWVDWLEKQKKSTWSEEDEERFRSCLSILLAKGLMGDTETVNTKWLKSIKERLKGE